MWPTCSLLPEGIIAGEQQRRSEPRYEPCQGCLQAIHGLLLTDGIKAAVSHGMKQGFCAFSDRPVCPMMCRLDSVL